MIDKIILFLERKGITCYLFEDVRTSYNSQTKSLILNHQADSRKILYSLLHEAGHAVLMENKESYHNLYPSKRHDDPIVKIWINDLLQEEYDAWQKGYELSQNLNLKIDIEMYQTYADRCLNTYRKFANCIRKMEDAEILSAKEMQYISDNL